jgi:stage III sporulation protein AF
MDTLFELIRRLVLLVIFAGFSELLLPRGSFRSYTRMVVGLLVIAMILNPFLGLRGAAWDLEGMLGTYSWSGTTHGLQGSLAQQDRAQELVEQQLAEQVRAFLAQDYPDHDIGIELDVDFDSYGNLAEFNGMDVILRPKLLGIQPVGPVNIGQASPEDIATPGQPELVNFLARHLGIPAAKLNIWVYTGGGDADAQ